MQFFYPILGLFLIILGFLAKKFPIIIAGYNTLSKEKRKQVDITGLSTYTRNGLIVLALLINFLYFVLIWFEQVSLAEITAIFVTLIGAFTLAIGSRKFIKNKPKKRYMLENVILIITVTFVALLFYFGNRPTKVELVDDKVLTNGFYGFNKSFDSINSLEMITTLPGIKSRTNGYSSGEVKKGFFRLSDNSKCRLLINSSTAPYILIKSENDIPTYINLQDSAHTVQLYRQIDKKLLK